MTNAQRRLVVFFGLMGMVTVARADPATTKPAATEASWSEESNGLRARLSMRRSSVTNGTGIITTYLELSNVSDIGNPMLVTMHEKHLKFGLSDADGHDVPMGGIGSFSGFSFGSPELVLPHDSSMRFPIGPRGWGIPGNQAALLDLGPRWGWVLPRDEKQYYLHAVLEIPKVKDDRSERGILWHGRLELPRVLVPTKPEPHRNGDGVRF